MKYNNTERLGIVSVYRIFSGNLNWIFRENAVNDFGIDAFVEITTFDRQGYSATGKLIAVQIKSGKSYFREEQKDHFVFRGKMKHLTYWLGHSIPVIIIIYDERSGNAYWREVNGSTAILTKKSFKVNILKKNLLGKNGREALTHTAFFKNSNQYRLWQLQSSIDEIKLLMEKGLFLYVEIDSVPGAGFYRVVVVISDSEVENVPEYIYSNNGENRFEYSFDLLEGSSLTEAINDIIPWADLFVGEEMLTDEGLTILLAEDILSYKHEEFTEDVLEMKRKNALLQLACYISGSSYLRIELKPNQLTYAFLLVDAFLNKSSTVKPRIFI